MMEKTLDMLKPGETGNIISIHGLGIIHKRLLDMGVTNGADVKVKRVAPLGDPIEIEIRGYNLSLRKNEASAITVIMK